MNCPRCQDSLSQAQRMGVEIDFCPRCRGVWLDGGELEKILERSQADDFGSGGDFRSRDHRGEHGRVEYRSEHLSGQHYDQVQHERHKHDQHRDFSHNREHGHDPRRGHHDDHHHHGHGKPHKKKKGFLGELFDIFD